MYATTKIKIQNRRDTMSVLFCSSPQLCILERQMQPPPGYRPRGGGFCVMNEAEWRSRGNYSEIEDCVISRMQIQFQSGIVMEQEIGNE